jgi:dipeptidyl aminopeptidase/acylaminoacyl peptidase
VIFVDPEGRWLLLNVQTTIRDYPSVWRIDLSSGDKTKVVSPQDNVWDWFADQNGNVRAGLAIDDGRWWLVYRKGDERTFKVVARHKFSEAEERGDIEKFIPVDGTDGGYAVSNIKTGRFGLYRYDFAKDVMGEAVFEHPQVDIDDFAQKENGEIAAIYYTDDRPRVVWLDPAMKATQSKIDEKLPGRINRVISLSRNHQRLIVRSGSASDPGQYYYFQPGFGSLSLLAAPYERIPAEALGQVEATSYRARDGLEIPAYLTTPRGRESKMLPLVVMPHGGPFLRDVWSYDVWAQFLANRGYVVLQPNYRGSTGYGKDFVSRGFGQWGRAMQDDLDDGVGWLVSRGIVDPKRVCIMGGSYGGYAALWAAARNPDIYRCAISFAGISDMTAMLKYDRKAFSASRYYRSWQDEVRGDKKFDLDTISPLYAVERISIPLLIAHGDRDQTVPMIQSKKMHEVLTRARKPHEYVIYPGEGHGFENVKDSVDFLQRVEKFLASYNPTD